MIVVKVVVGGDNGRELFGIDTVKADGTKASDGFDALSDLDSNNDKVFDAKDARFADVRIWRDLNQDGIIQLTRQTRLASYRDKIQVTINKQGELALDFSAMNALIDSRYNSHAAEILADLTELVRYFGADLAAAGWNGFDLLKTRVAAAEGKKAEEKVLSDLHVHSGNATGDSDDEIFFADAKGSTIRGQGDNDTYLFGRGDGNTTVYNYDRGANREDIVRFTARHCAGRYERLAQAIRGGHNSGKMQLTRYTTAMASVARVSRDFSGL